MTDFDVDAEFDRQVQTLVDKGYPALAGMELDAFRDLVFPLRQVVLDRKADLMRPTKSQVPFVLVITKELVPPTAAMPLTELSDRIGFVTDGFDDVDQFAPIESVEIPAGGAYILFDVDRGAEYLDVRPNDALRTITGAGRTPLTVDEGSRSSCSSRIHSRRTTASPCWPLEWPINESPPCGSAGPDRSSGGVGRATRTPGWAVRQRATEPASPPEPTARIPQALGTLCA